MSYKIVVDSCCELPENYKNDSRFEIVPLGLEVGDYIIQDDANFNQREFLQKVAAYPLCPKSSCPSPERFREAYHDGAAEVYAVTLSSHLSGSYTARSWVRVFTQRSTAIRKFMWWTLSPQAAGRLSWWKRSSPARRQGSASRRR